MWPTNIEDLMTEKSNTEIVAITGHSRYAVARYRNRLKIPLRKISDIDRFMKFVTVTESCWLWCGSKSSNGYGSFRVDGTMVVATRFSYTFFCGEIPSGMLVCHTCDTPACVNPEHLWLGTHYDNAQDMLIKRRHPQQNQTHCKHGHNLDALNTYVCPKTGKRGCRKCRSKRSAEFQAQNQSRYKELRRLRYLRDKAKHATEIVALFGEEA